INGAVVGAGTAALEPPFTKAVMLTFSVPFSVLAVIVTVLVILLEPLPLNLTVKWPISPLAKGCLDQSSGTVQPQELLISVITKGASPTFLYVKTVSTCWLA